MIGFPLANKTDFLNVLTNFNELSSLDKKCSVKELNDYVSLFSNREYQYLNSDNEDEPSYKIVQIINSGIKQILDKTKFKFNFTKEIIHTNKVIFGIYISKCEIINIAKIKNMITSVEIIKEKIYPSCNSNIFFYEEDTLNL
jgi:hypothetical protein